MSFISEFGDMLQQTVTLAEKTGQDAYGKPSFGVGVNYASRVSYKPTKVRMPDGREVVAKGLVWTSYVGTFTPEDRLTLPDGSIPPILAIDKLSDEHGQPHHMKVYFG